MSRVWLVVLVAAMAVAARAEDPDIGRTGPELITSKGYPLEQHWAETPDSFVLNMFRIPRPGAPAVFLQHGLLDSADTWILNSANDSLAFILYDAGFDVWLGNSRGNKYSRNNTEHSPNWPFDGDFWDFSWDDMAQYDVPTQINYALATSGQSKIGYVGHSQGCTQALANFVTPDWSVADKISVFVGLAPVAFLHNTPDVFLKALADLDLDVLVKFLGVHEFLPTSEVLRWLLPTVCNATPQLCDSVIYLFAGLDLGDLDQSRMPVYTAHFPSGTSAKDMVHWGQAVRNNVFQRYDYGILGNPLHYGGESVPAYDLTQFASPPMAIFWGGQDPLADDTDVRYWLNNLVPENTIAYQQFVPEFGHLDFVWGEHADTVVYPNVVDALKQFA